MATRPVYCVSEKYPYYKTVNVEFDWNGGFAVTQKRKNITAMHSAYRRRHPQENVLEISSKSMQEHGKDLSAFFLKKYVPEIGESVPVECVFQGGKVFEDGGPFKELYHMHPRDAKRYNGLQESGRLTGFEFDGRRFPTEPKTLFYDYLYISALFENRELWDTVLKYDAFTDIEFNPERSLNCQAKAAAVFVSLHRLGLLSAAENPDAFEELYLNHMPASDGQPEKKAAPEPAPEEQVIRAGMTIIHKVWGSGIIIAAGASTIEAEFESQGRKKLGLKWVRENCTIN